LAQGVIDQPAPGVPDPTQNIATARDFCRQWRARQHTIQPSVFCHSLYACSRETVVSAKRLCDEFGLLFQIHAAETRWESEHIRALHGMSPVRLLDRAGVLDEHTLLAHCVWVDAEDIAVIAERRANVSHNPESNMKLASGVAPVAKMLAAGIPVGLGTDGCASNNDLDLFAAMDMTAKLHKVMNRDPTVLSAETVIRMATLDGARALGLDREIGSLEPGKQADLIIVETRVPHLTPLHQPVSAIVYAAKGSDVRTVMVGGRLLVKNRRVLAVDMEDVMHRVGRISQALSDELKRKA
jgi:5-methylthioadenosine/S-adenosylhomocysteine deaminase